MGSRDNRVIDDQRYDELLLRLLERSGQPAVVEQPPDLVTRTMRLLPHEVPAAAGQAAMRRARRRLILRAILTIAVVLIAAFGIWSVLGGGPSLALIIGDGVSGLSRVLLTVQLLAKPLLRTAGIGDGLWMMAGLLALAGLGWLWWRLLRRTPVVYAERAT
jgi:hypothetical protein